MKEHIIEVRGLKKSYGAVPAVNGIDFSLCKGQMTAILGPNGAGKSTLINILSTAIERDDGKLLIGGMDPDRNKRKIRKMLGVVFQNGILDDQLTVEENLRVRAKFYGIRGSLLKRYMRDTTAVTGVDMLMDRRYGSLSGGQKRRCDIARAMIHSPQILFLDEPTAGLDPEMRDIIWKTVDDIRKKTAMTVIMTTHYMEEASAADHIMILRKGKIAFEGTPDMIKSRFSKDRLILYSWRGNKTVELRQTMDALRILEEQRGRYDSFEVLRGTIDSAYMTVIEDENMIFEKAFKKGDCDDRSGA